MARQADVTRQSKQAWAYYGYPGSETAAVGEVGYVVDWRADQMSRLEWDVFIDGSPSWVVELPNTESEREPVADDSDAVVTEGRISTRRTDGQEDQTAASMELLDLIDWNDTNIRAVDNNLFVAGKGDYVNLREQGWRVVSTIEPKRKETLASAADVIGFINPHPANPAYPNPPLGRILDLLESLAWLTRQSSTQSKQRVLMNGIVVTSDKLTGSTPESTFWGEWNATLSAKQTDPDDMSPVRLQAPSDEVAKGAIEWILPPFGYDDVLDRKISAAIDRLGYGMPVPPEILKGMQAQSRATAFQVEENAYRAHIEPPAKLLAQVAQDALNKLLPDVKVRVVPNPTQMLARKQSVEDVKWARENGLVNPTYTREVLGIPEDAAPEEDDGVPISNAPVERDPANVAADEPVTAATRTPDLSTLLADIDMQLSSELAGVTVMATDRARQRLGAAARSVESVRQNGAKNLTNSRLAAHLGLDGLTAAGVNIDDQIAEPVGSAAEWWTQRVGEAWGQAATLVPGWTGQGEWVENSIRVLSDALEDHIKNTLSQSGPSPLDAGAIREVVDAAAGGTANGVR